MPDASDMHYDISVGRRIQAIRKQRGLTQHGLAQRAAISYSTLTKVESGHTAASPIVTAACARALRVPVTDLTGQPYVDALRQDQLDELVQPLRHVVIGPMRPDDTGPPPRDLGAVQDEIARLDSSRLRGEYMAIGSKGPALIGELLACVAVAREGEERRAAYGTLATAYCLARYFTHKLGFLDLGLLALERMEAAAARSSDPHLPAVVCHYRSDYMVHHGAYGIGLAEVERMERMLADPVRRGDRRALSLQGTLHLKAAVIHARRGRPSAAQDVKERIREAKRTARRLRGAPDPYGLVFDPSNVAIHAVSTQIDLGNAGRAVETGEQVRLPAGWALNRQGHHLMDMARAHEQIGRPEEALSMLVKARGAAPAQTRYHPTTRETVHALLRRRGTPPRELRSFARWLGV